MRSSTPRRRVLALMLIGWAAAAAAATADVPVPPAASVPPLATPGAADDAAGEAASLDERDDPAGAVLLAAGTPSPPALPPPRRVDSDVIPDLLQYKEQLMKRLASSSAGGAPAAPADVAADRVLYEFEEPPFPALETETERELDGPAHHRTNFASQAAGAVIMASNPEMTNVNSLLAPDSDSYALSKCDVKKFVVIGLSEDVIADAIVISNDEKYSSAVQHFRVTGSQKFPTNEWLVLGNFTAANVLGEQTFPITVMSFVRFVKVSWLSHYGNEFYCTWTRVKVHGSTMLEDLQNNMFSSEAEVAALMQQMNAATPTAAPPIAISVLPTPPAAAVVVSPTAVTATPPVAMRTVASSESSLEGGAPAETATGLDESVCMFVPSEGVVNGSGRVVCPVPEPVWSPVGVRVLAQSRRQPRGSGMAPSFAPSGGAHSIATSSNVGASSGAVGDRPVDVAAAVLGVLSPAVAAAASELLGVLQDADVGVREGDGESAAVPSPLRVVVTAAAAVIMGEQPLPHLPSHPRVPLAPVVSGSGSGVVVSDALSSLAVELQPIPTFITAVAAAATTTSTTTPALVGSGFVPPELLVVGVVGLGGEGDLGDELADVALYLNTSLEAIAHIITASGTVDDVAAECALDAASTRPLFVATTRDGAPLLAVNLSRAAPRLTSSAPQASLAPGRGVERRGGSSSNDSEGTLYRGDSVSATLPVTVTTLPAAAVPTLAHGGHPSDYDGTSTSLGGDGAEFAVVDEEAAVDDDVLRPPRHAAAAPMAPSDLPSFVATADTATVGAPATMASPLKGGGGVDAAQAADWARRAAAGPLGGGGAGGSSGVGLAASLSSGPGPGSSAASVFKTLTRKLRGLELDQSVISSYLAELHTTYATALAHTNSQLEASRADVAALGASTDSLHSHHRDVTASLTRAVLEMGEAVAALHLQHVRLHARVVASDREVQRLGRLARRPSSLSAPARWWRRQQERSQAHLQAAHQLSDGDHAPLRDGMDEKGRVVEWRGVCEEEEGSAEVTTGGALDDDDSHDYCGRDAAQDGSDDNDGQRGEEGEEEEDSYDGDNDTVGASTTDTDDGESDAVEEVHQAILAAVTSVQQQQQQQQQQHRHTRPTSTSSTGAPAAAPLVRGPGHLPPTSSSDSFDDPAESAAVAETTLQAASTASAVTDVAPAIAAATATAGVTPQFAAPSAPLSGRFVAWLAQFAGGSTSARGEEAANSSPLGGGADGDGGGGAAAASPATTTVPPPPGAGEKNAGAGRVGGAAQHSGVGTQKRQCRKPRREHWPTHSSDAGDGGADRHRTACGTPSLPPPAIPDLVALREEWLATALTAVAAAAAATSPSPPPTHLLFFGHHVPASIVNLVVCISLLSTLAWTATLMRAVWSCLRECVGRAPPPTASPASAARGDGAQRGLIRRGSSSGNVGGDVFSSAWGGEGSAPHSAHISSSSSSSQAAGMWSAASRSPVVPPLSIRGHRAPSTEVRATASSAVPSPKPAQHHQSALVGPTPPRQQALSGSSPSGTGSASPRQLSVGGSGGGGGSGNSPLAGRVLAGGGAGAASLGGGGGAYYYTDAGGRRLLTPRLSPREGLGPGLGQDATMHLARSPRLPPSGTAVLSSR